MFEHSIKESKPLPDFTGTDDYQVFLTLRGEVQDVLFLKFLEKVGEDTLELFTTQDLLVLDLIHREQKIPDVLQERLVALRERGIIETIGRGRGSRQMLSRKLYTFIGKTGVYSRKKGLDRSANRALLLEHLSSNGPCGMQDLQQVLPHLSRDQITWLLRGLRKEAKGPRKNNFPV